MHLYLEHFGADTREHRRHETPLGKQRLPQSASLAFRDLSPFRAHFRAAFTGSPNRHGGLPAQPPRGERQACCSGRRSPSMRAAGGGRIRRPGGLERIRSRRRRSLQLSAQRPTCPAAARGLSRTLLGFRRLEGPSPAAHVRVILAVLARPDSGTDAHVDHLLAQVGGAR